LACNGFVLVSLSQANTTSLTCECSKTKRVWITRFASKIDWL